MLSERGARGVQKAELNGNVIQKTTTEAPRGHMYYIGLDVHKKTISYCVPEAGLWQFSSLQSLSRAQSAAPREVIFDACSACLLRASTLQASVQPRRVCLPLSGAGSRQGLWLLRR